MEKLYIKMQGLGNSFLVCQGPLELQPANIQKACSENAVDGFLVVAAIDKQNVRMQYWNGDGSKAEMCGNGLRCVVRFAIDNQLVKAGDITALTDVGPLKAVWDGKDSNHIEVQVGKASLNQKPVVLHNCTFYEVNVGNPHAITFVDNVKTAPVTSLGPIIETDKHFPNKTNVEFAAVRSPQQIQVRVWERGVGETKACGTGMVATACAAAQLQNVELPVEVQVPGGSAQIWQDDTGYFRMLGPAEYVF
jgi:diaminopimelate epimerase